MSLFSHDIPETENTAPAYLLCETPGHPPIRVHADVVNGIRQEVIEGYNALPKRGVEVGGILLGRCGAEIFIDAFESIACEHRFGPSYILSDRDQAALDEVMRSHQSDSRRAVIGYYRSHTRKDFQIEESDLELIERWFSSPASVFLLIRPLDISTIEAEFFFHEAGRVQLESRGRTFPFASGAVTFSAASVPDSGERRTHNGDAPSPPPDAVAGPPPKPLPDPVQVPITRRARTSEPEPVRRSWIAKHWEIPAALALVAGAVFLLWQNRPIEDEKPAPAPSAASQVAPSPELGLDVRPGTPQWRISWNASAPPIQNADRGILEIEDGDVKRQLPLDKVALQRGERSYSPVADDVTFRLQVIGPGEQLSSESFRVLLAAKEKKTAQPAGAMERLARPSPPSSAKGGTTPPQLVRRAEPEVPPGIRARIDREFSVDVRVYVNASGRVVRAEPLARATDLQGFLIRQAVDAAKRSQFEPALQDGRPVAGSQVIHFVFHKGP